MVARWAKSKSGELSKVVLSQVDRHARPSQDALS